MIRSIRLVFSGLLATALALVLGANASATVTQTVTADYDDGTSSLTDLDTVDDPVDPLTDTIFAAVNGFYGSATGSVGVYGDLGVEGALRGPATAGNTVLISNDYVPNLSGIGRRAQLRFIIDGGELNLLGQQGSTLTFSLSLLGFIFDSNDDFVDFINWSTGVTMEENGSFGSGLDISFTGEDIGAQVMPGRDWGVEIPLSFQTVDIGEIPPGGYADFSYSLIIQGDSVGFPEIISWQFSDPLSVDDFGVAPEIVFDPIPEPTTALMLVVGLGLVGLSRR